MASHRVFSKSLARSVCGIFAAYFFADVPRAKAELAKPCAAMTLTPEGSTFRIARDWNLLGGSSNGAGGAACTILPQAKFFVTFAA